MAENEKELTPEEKAEQEKTYGQEFIEDLVKLIQTRKQHYDFMVGLKVVPMAALPNVPWMILPCEDCNQILVPSNNGKDVTMRGAKAFPHTIVVSFGQKERSLVFFIGVCDKCDKRFIVAHINALKAIAYYAIFGDWPEEG